MPTPSAEPCDRGADRRLASPSVLLQYFRHDCSQAAIEHASTGAPDAGLTLADAGKKLEEPGYKGAQGAPVPDAQAPAGHAPVA